MIPTVPDPPKKRVRWLKWLAIFTLVGAVVVTAVVSLGVMGLKKSGILPANVTVADATRAFKAVTAPTPEAAHIAFGDRQTLNLLVLGIDYDYTDSDLPFSKNARSDTIFVLQVRRDGNYVGMLSMPRDMYVEFPDGSHDKVNAAYGRGGIKLEKEMLSKFLGVDFDNYFVVRIDAATKLVDRLGGLDIDVEKDMDYDDNWGHLHVHLKKGPQHLNGEQAVGYARFRHDEDGDRGRMRRQQVVINALLDKLKSTSTYKDPISLLTDIAKIAHDSLETDAKTDHLLALANVYMHFDKHNMRTAQLDGADTTADGQSVIQPPPPDKVEKIAHSVIRPENPEDVPPVDVEILNGSPVGSAARDLQKVLEAHGYHVIYVGGADKPEATSRAIVYTLDDPQRAQLTKDLAAFSGTSVPMQTPLEAGGQWQSNPNFTDVTVIVGSDYKPRKSGPHASASPTMLTPHDAGTPTREP